MTDSQHPDLPQADLAQRLLDVRTWTAHDVDADGRVLAGHDDLGTMQLVEIAPDGTRTPLTDLPGKCSGRYIPGRRAVVVQHDTGGDENMQLSLLDLTRPMAAPAVLENLEPLLRDTTAMHVLQDVDETSLVYSTNRRNHVDMDVVVRDLASGQERIVYDGGGYVAATHVSHDRENVAVTRLSLQPASTVVDVTGPRARQGGPFTDPEELALHSDVAWAADDESLIMASNSGREYAAIVRAPLDGSSWTTLAEDTEHDLGVWVSPDAQSMVVGTLIDGSMRLAVHEKDGTVRCEVRLSHTGMAGVVWSPDSTRFVVVMNAPTEPGALMLVNAETGEGRVVASSAQEMDPSVRALLHSPVVHRVPTPDVEQIPCFVYSPVNQVLVDGSPGDEPAGDGATADGATSAFAGASVIHIHGGPESAANQTFHPVIALLVASGLTVLVPNVRGSTGYGKRWVSLDDVDKRLDSVADLAALHAWLPTQGLDQQRSALWGGSYGGYMVLAGVSMQPHLWAAGVDIVGMSSLVTFLENTSDYRRAYREREYGSLAEHREVLTAASPITYLDEIVAPLFVIHGANDPRVPLSEAEQIKAALDDKQVPCELRVYWDEGHGLAKRSNKVDAYPAALDFLRRHLDPTRA